MDGGAEALEFLRSCGLNPRSEAGGLAGQTFDSVIGSPMQALVEKILAGVTAGITAGLSGAVSGSASGASASGAASGGAFEKG